MSKPDPIIDNPTTEATKPPPAIDIEAMAASMKASIAKAEDESNALDVASISSKPLTYFNTKQCPFYTKAKQILQTGDFEAALSKIATGLTTILSLLPADGTDNDLHEALAPLYYMYGTTLLYSVEESQESAEASVMAQGAGAAADSAEDLQIAWENLESARSILTKMKCDGDCGKEEEERVLDLAQLHSRLADLSRHNGHYEQAIKDYESCCESRRSQLQGDQVWDRRIADVEYSLGMTSLLLAAEGEKNLMNENDDEGDGNGEAGKKNKEQNAAIAAMAAAAGATMPAPEEGEKVKLSKEEIRALRDKALRHYVQCARILAGIISTMSGANPSETAAADSSLENDENKKCAAASGKKTNGLDTNLSLQKQASEAISTVRDRISKLKATDTSDSDAIHDLCEMLDEIQETVDNCEQDSEGLKDVNKMRKKVEEDIKKSDDGDGFAASAAGASDASGGTTTIGFGNSADGKPAAASLGTTSTGFSAASAASSSSIGFGDSAASSGKAAAPMMVVKKKKKVQLENKNAKRAKTE